MYKLKKGDKVAIVSLSNGILGESFCNHQLKLGIKRLESFGLEVVFSKNSLKGVEFLKNNPEEKAKDLVEVFNDKSIKGIICSIGGIDGIKIVPYILDNPEYVKIIKENPKFFMGYSDTTNHHLLLYKLGIKSFYGLSYITDFAELDGEMLKYSKDAFLNIFTEDNFKYKSSDFWFEERTKFDESCLNTSRIKHKEENGYVLLKGNNKFSGELIGGCIESINELISDDNRFGYGKEINDKYDLWPKNQLKDKIVFLETSELKISPLELEKILEVMKPSFKDISGLLIGKPQDEKYYEEYKNIYLKVFENYDFPIVYNVNFGHSYPKMLLQYGALAHIDMEKEIIEIERV